MAEPTSLRAFARLMRCNESSVRKAIGNGRLELSVGRDARGRPVIVDVQRAMEEWEENYDPVRERR